MSKPGGSKRNVKTLSGNIIEPRAGEAKNMVIFLHGYGANGDDLLSIGRNWAEDLPDTVFLAPNAPDVCEMSDFGYQWFSIREIDNKAVEREKQMEKAVPVLNAFIDEQLKKLDVEESHLVVAGFSQGAMMAMYTMPRRKKPCAGVIGYSGLLVDAEGLKGKGIVQMPILAIHGEADDVVPPHFLAGVQSGFDAAGFSNVETIMRPGLPHGIDAFGVTRGLEFAKEVLEK